MALDKAIKCEAGRLRRRADWEFARNNFGVRRKSIRKLYGLHLAFFMARVILASCAIGILFFAARDNFAAALGAFCAALMLRAAFRYRQ